MKKLFTRLKYYILSLFRTKNGQAVKIFNTVQSGDVVYCLMPLNDHILKKIEKDHRVRPYVIIDKRDDHLIAFQCSTSYIPKGPRYSYHTLKAARYEKRRDSYIDLTRTYMIPYRNIRSYFMTVDHNDQAIINKKLDMLAKRNGTDHRFKVKAVPSSGDIIDINGRSYYIHRVKDGKMLAIPTVTEKPKYRVDLKNGFYLDIKKASYIDLDADFRYIGMYGKTYQELVQKRLEESHQRPEHIYPSGTIMNDGKNDVLLYLATIGTRHQVIDLTAYFTGRIEKELTFLMTCDTLEGLKPGGNIDNRKLKQILKYLEENGYTLTV